MDELVAVLKKDPQANNVVALVDASYSRILQDWEYSAATSDHRRLASHTVALARVLEIITSQNQALAKTVVGLIVERDLKVIYRCLNLVRPAVSVPALEVLNWVAQVSPMELYNSFDFALRVLPKLLEPRNPQIRRSYLRFYATLAEHSILAVRRDLILANRKIWSGWVTHLNQDPEEQVIWSLDLWRKLILSDSALGRPQPRSQLFNDWCLKHLVSLLKHRGVASDAMASFLVDLHPPHPLSLLKLLRPWENGVQMDLVVRFLRDDRSLVTQYFSSLADGYSLSPKVSMFWFNFAVLHVRVIAACGIIPRATATRSAFQAGLSFRESTLVQFMTAEIVLESLRALEGQPGQIVQKLAEDHLPSAALFLQPRTPELLQTVFLECARMYARLGLLQAQLPAVLLGVLDSPEPVRGLALVRAQDTLELEATAGGLARWWSKVRGSHSLFTKLCRFATINPLLRTQVQRLLEFLAAPTLAFSQNNVTVSTPIEILLYTLAVTTPDDRVWGLLDEVVSRIARAPYPYIDRFPTPKVSPFAACLAEQLAFVTEESGESVKTFVLTYLRNLTIAGEANDVLDKCFPNHPAVNLPLDEYVEYVLVADENSILARSDLVFKIENALDVAATALRIQRSSQQLADHLLSNIPVDCAAVLTHPVCARRLLPSIGEKYVKMLRLHQLPYSELLAPLLESWNDWPKALEYLSTVFLLDHMINADVVKELESRSLAITPEVTERVKSVLAETTDPSLASALIQWAHWYDPSVVRLNNNPGVLASAARFVEGSITWDPTQELIADAETMPLLAAFASDLTDAHKAGVDTYMATAKSFDRDLAILSNFVDGDGVRVWLKRSVLLITRHLAEHKPLDKLSPILLAISAKGLLAAASVASINALVEAAVTRPDRNEALLEFTGRLVVEASLDTTKAGKLDRDKHLHLLLEQPESLHVLQENLLAFVLYEDGAASSAMQRLILRRYGGSSSAADQLLLSILRKLEVKLKRSWIDDVAAWEFGERSLITVVSPHEFQITLDKTRILDTVRTYDSASRVDATLIEETTGTWASKMEVLKAHDVAHVQRGYAEEFLLGALISCDYIFKPDGKIDVKTLADTGCLGFVLCCLGSSYDDISDTARQLLVTIVSSSGLDEYKEHVAVRLLISKVLVYLQDRGTNDNSNMPAHLSTMLGQLQPVITNPSHFLHEKVSDWLLSGPSIREYDLPLWPSIMASTSENKVREIIWLVHYLTSALVDSQTVNTYLKRGVFEWALAQTSPPVKRAVRELLNKAADFGAMSLITRGGGLATDAAPILVQSSSPQSLVKWVLPQTPVNGN